MNGKMMYNRCILPDITLEERMKRGKKIDSSRKAAPVNEKERSPIERKEEEERIYRKKSIEFKLIAVRKKTGRKVYKKQVTFEDEIVPKMKIYQEEIIKEMKEKTTDELIAGRTKKRKRKKIGGKREVKDEKEREERKQRVMKEKLKERLKVISSSTHKKKENHTPGAVHPHLTLQKEIWAPLNSNPKSHLLRRRKFHHQLRDK